MLTMLVLREAHRSLIDGVSNLAGGRGCCIVRSFTFLTLRTESGSVICFKLVSDCLCDCRMHAKGVKKCWRCAKKRGGDRQKRIDKMLIIIEDGWWDRGDLLHYFLCFCLTFFHNKMEKKRKCLCLKGWFGNWEKWRSIPFCIWGVVPKVFWAERGL